MLKCMMGTTGLWRWYLLNLCKNNKQFQVKYTYVQTLYSMSLNWVLLNLLFFFIILAWTKLFNVEITFVFL